jgi:hypothetical protein
MEKLMQSDVEQLYAELGLRQKAIQEDPRQAGLFETTAAFDAPFAGPMDSLRELGRDFFRRVSKDAYNLVCGRDKEDADERKKIQDAFRVDATTVAAALSAALVSWFGWAPAIAGVVAALVMKLFFKNAYEATCDIWKKSLPS